MSKKSQIGDDETGSVFAYSRHQKKQVHVGLKHQWDMSHRNNLRWTPLPGYPNAKRATPGFEHFEKQDYHCCNQKECSLQMKVGMARINRWYFAVEPGKREGEWKNNCSYSHSRGEGEHHSHVKFGIAEFLRKSPNKEEYRVGKVEVEIMRSKAEFPGTEVTENVIPDITIIHSVDSGDKPRFTYIEVVDTHPIENYSHECYGENVVIVNISYYRDDREALLKFVDNELAIILKKQFDMDVRQKEWEQRQEKFERKNKQILQEEIEVLYAKHEHEFPSLRKPRVEEFATVEEVQQYFTTAIADHKQGIEVDRARVRKEREDARQRRKTETESKLSLSKKIDEAITKDRDIDILSLKEYSRGLVGKHPTTNAYSQLIGSGVTRDQLFPISLHELQAYVVVKHGLVEYQTFRIRWQGIVPLLSAKYRRNPLVEKGTFGFRRKDKLYIRCLIMLFEEFERSVSSDKYGSQFSKMFNTPKYNERSLSNVRTTHMLNETIKEDITYGMLLKLSSNDGISDLNGVIKSKTFLELNAKNYLMYINKLKKLDPGLWTSAQGEEWNNSIPKTRIEEIKKELQDAEETIRIQNEAAERKEQKVTVQDLLNRQNELDNNLPSKSEPVTTPHKPVSAKKKPSKPKKQRDTKNPNPGLRSEEERLTGILNFFENQVQRGGTKKQMKSWRQEINILNKQIDDLRKEKLE